MRTVRVDMCSDGHDFQAVTARNDATDRGAGAKAGWFGFGAGAKGHSKHDHGDRVVLYCKKCGEAKKL